MRWRESSSTSSRSCHAASSGRSSRSAIASRSSCGTNWIGGVAADVFDVADLEGTTLAVLSLCIDLARWYEPSPEHNSAEAVGELYAGLVIRMLRKRELSKRLVW